MEADQKMGDKREKSNFSHTCRLLRQYLKEKGGLGLDMAPKPLHQQPMVAAQSLPTMTLLPGVDVSEANRTGINQEKNCIKSMDLFPQHTGFGSATLPKEESVKTSEAKQREKDQLTIFYGGKVMVFDDFPADKAKDLMHMASQGTIAVQTFSFSSPHTATAAADSSLSKANNPSDMPIARRNSLNRFLEKRKDRINTVAPYQVNGSSAKPECSQSWLNLGRQDLKSEHSSE